jgi:probable rRNA maturation factor
LKIRIFYDNVNFRLKKSKKIRELIEKVIMNEKKYSDGLLFIFTNDEKIREINKEFIKHNRYTDVIAFDDSKGKNIIGEIYISIDTVKRNAYNYKISLIIEVLRIMIHGTLHLCGYEDKSERLKKKMTEIEDKWIEEYRKV